MFSKIIGLSLTMVVLAPVIALAQPNSDCEQQKQGNEVMGAVVGGGLGALFGNAVSGGRTGGTIIGGVGGAAVGASVAGGGVHCGDAAYGYYDPAGRWIANGPTPDGSGGPDQRWSPGPPPPYIAGGPPGPGYGPSPGAYGGPAAGDTRERETRLEARIHERLSDGSLARDSAGRDFRRLEDVRQRDAAYRDGNGDGSLSPGQYQDIDQRLDELRRELAIASPPAQPY
jgi:hypothetical protein